MSNVKTYPRYEINVKDNSIYNLNVDTPLPVHRALWVLPTQMGPEGDPIWIRDTAHFERVFGKDTLALANSKYQSQTTYWLRQLLKLNGQFIMRAVDEKCERSNVVLYAVVKEIGADRDAGIAKLKREYDLAGNPTGTVYKVAADVFDRCDVAVANAADVDIYSSANYGQSGVEIENNVVVTAKRYYYDKNGACIGYFIYDNLDDATTTNDHLDDDVEINLISGLTKNDVDSSELKFFHTCTPVKEAGLQITFKLRAATDEQKIDIENNEINAVNFKSITTEDGIEYPILVVAANYVGSYGNDLAFRFYSKPSNNNPESLEYYKTVFNTFGAFIRPANQTSTTPVTSIFSQNTVDVSADPNALDPELQISKGMEAVLESNYDSTGESSDELPFMIFSFEENLKIIGEHIAQIEQYNPINLGLTDLGYTNAQDVEAAFNSGELTGYMIDVLGGVNADGNPYPHVIYGGQYYSTEAFTLVFDRNISDALTSTDPTSFMVVCPPYTSAPNGVTLDSTTDIFLSGGSDGDLWDTETGAINRAFMDKAMYDMVTLKTNPKLIDKFRYPFTHIYDIGYSMPTKYAMIDFIGSIRDDVMLELTTQILLSSSWLTGYDRPIKVNSMQDDVTTGLLLRERALLTKESLINNTDAMRCAIYPQCGQPVDVSWQLINGKMTTFKPTSIVPFVFWSAYQHAMYENTSVMSVQEPRGLPYSYNRLFKSWSWMPHSEKNKELVWNRGINYCQHADMSEIFYPALRTVYRAETSVLVDQWDVDCLVYLKHECRKAWAQFTGRNDKVAVLQTAISDYLNGRLHDLFNGKYNFTVEVYQTEEEQKIGYIQHVRIVLTLPATLRQIVFDIEVNREGYTPEQ